MNPFRSCGDGAMSLLHIVLVLTTFAGRPNAADYRRKPRYPDSGRGEAARRLERLEFLVLVEVGGAAVCSAALITPQWAVTAAHCVERAPLAQVTLRAGHLPGAAGRGQEWEQTRALRHAELFPSHKRLLFDLALLRPSAPFIDTALVGPLPVCRNWGFPHRGELCLSAGWQPQNGSGARYRPRYLLVHVLKQDRCQDYYGVRFHRSMVCAKAEAGRWLWQGAGGGPLVCRGLLTAVAKGLVDSDPQRAHLLPQVAGAGNTTFMAYTAVGKYRRWMGSHVRNMKLDWLARAPPRFRPPPPLLVLALLASVALPAVHAVTD